MKCRWRVLLLNMPGFDDRCQLRLPLAFPDHFRRSNSKNSKTFRPKKNIPEGTNQYELKKYAEATLGSGNLRVAVALPPGEDLNEWVAVNSLL